LLDDVALPLAEQHPDDALELVLGYDQERLRAIALVQLRSAREAEQTPSRGVVTLRGVGNVFAHKRRH